jgi:hypothetical protein
MEMVSMMTDYFRTELYSRFDRDLLESCERRGELWHYEEAMRFLADTGGDQRGTLKQARLRIGDFLIASGLKLKGQTGLDSSAPIAQVQ